ncbi:MAG: TetR/AcrR family transcriptional regulator [Anaerolineae bacterium]
MSDTRAEILDAAGRLITREGVKTLTIDNVATEAGISRGGVLYHFASKDALIQGMLDRLISNFERIMADEVTQDDDPHGRQTRAFARATLRMDEETSAVFAPLIAAIAYNPELLQPLNERWTQWQQMMEAEIDPVKGAVVRLASHALWLSDLFSMNTFDRDQKRAIVAHLEDLTRRA